MEKSILEILFFFSLILISVKPLGLYIYKVIEGERTFLTPVFSGFERLLYKIIGTHEQEEQNWKQYLWAILYFSLFGLLFTFVLQMIQGSLPLNTQNLPGTSWHLALNTAVSFTTNTNWQSYVPEQTMSYLTQMIGLATHNFMSAATGIAVLVALIRGFTRKETNNLGNAWVDLTRVTLYILMPISIIAAVILISQGVPQNFNVYTEATTIEGAKQFIPQGPIASQEAIKMLGTNGGGFLNANSAHPYENPTPLSNILQMWMLTSVAASLTYTFGKMVKDTRQGWAILTAMMVILFSFTCFETYFENHGNPLIASAYSNDLNLSDNNIVGNMEGKETRFGINQSTIFATITTAVSCGAVNSMHDSYTALGGLIPMFNMHLGEIILGGVGSGLYVMLLFCILTVFIAGLMVGRTPEYLGKKIGAKEMQSTVLGIVTPSIFILVLTAIACITTLGTGALNNPWSHGFSEILYAYTSAGANNGSAFAGLSANSVFWNCTLALAMFCGRFIPIMFILRLAGTLSEKKYIPASAGTFPTNSTTFVVLLIGIVIIVGGLTFFPALTLGPIAEHFQILAGKSF
jgi:K+-transporting ATPase ATPase A chain